MPTYTNTFIYNNYNYDDLTRERCVKVCLSFFFVIKKFSSHVLPKSTQVPIYI